MRWWWALRLISSFLSSPFHFFFSFSPFLLLRVIRPYIHIPSLYKHPLFNWSSSFFFLLPQIVDYQIYQPWVLKTYGDQSKSKTITLKKQSRILSTLKGLESHRSDSSKFRFWVRSKGNAIKALNATFLLI